MAINPTNPEDAEKQEKLKALSEALDLNRMKIDISSLHDTVAYIRTRVEETIAAINQNTEIINRLTGTPANSTTTSSQVQNNPPGPLDQIQKVQMLSEAAEGIAKIVTAWKGNPGGAPQGYQMDLVNTIIGAFSKLIQVQVDNAVLNTYPQARGVLEPPDWAFKSRPSVGVHKLA